MKTAATRWHQTVQSFWVTFTLLVSNHKTSRLQKISAVLPLLWLYPLLVLVSTVFFKFWSLIHLFFIFLPGDFWTEMFPWLVSFVVAVATFLFCLIKAVCSATTVMMGLSLLSYSDFSVMLMFFCHLWAPSDFNLQPGLKRSSFQRHQTH